MKLPIIIEKTDTGFSAYSPDLPGCVATGSTRDEIERNMKDVIVFHIDGLKEEGEEIPDLQTEITFLELPA